MLPCSSVAKPSPSSPAFWKWGTEDLVCGVFFYFNFNTLRAKGGRYRGRAHITSVGQQADAWKQSCTCIICVTGENIVTCCSYNFCSLQWTAAVYSSPALGLLVVVQGTFCCFVNLVRKTGCGFVTRIHVWIMVVHRQCEVTRVMEWNL